MRIALYFWMLVLCLPACHSTRKKITEHSETAPKNDNFITWDTKFYDLGEVKKGEKRDLKFAFTNTSGEPIQIDIVDACHCTTVDFPRGIIPPGGRAELPVTFDSSEKDADETIGIYLYFKQTDKNGNPRIERVEYAFKLIK